jgi:membrane protease YdiL (CAAX protease family)
MPEADGSAEDVAPAPRRRRRPEARWSPGFATLVVVLGLIAGQAVAIGVALAAGGADGPDWVIAASLVLADVVVLGIIVAAARRGTERLGASTLGLRRTDFGPALGWTLVGWVALIAVGGVWALIVGEGPRESGSGPRLDLSDPVVVGLFAFTVCVGAPIVEEIAFRGYLFAALTRWRGPWPAAVLSGLLFGAAHAAVYPPELLPPLAVFGVVLAMVFWFTGSLLPCIALHALNNALVTGIALGWDWQVPVLILGSIAVALGLLWPVSRERAPQVQQA